MWSASHASHGSHCASFLSIPGTLDEANYTDVETEIQGASFGISMPRRRHPTLVRANKSLANFESSEPSLGHSHR